MSDKNKPQQPPQPKPDAAKEKAEEPKAEEPKVEAPKFDSIYLVNKHKRTIYIDKARGESMVAKEPHKYRRATDEEIEAYKKANPPIDNA